MNFKDVFFNTNDYEIIEKDIGHGAFGKVHIVKNIEENKKYAAKILYVDEDFNCDEQMRFLSESFILRKVDHPSIVHFIGINFQSFKSSNTLSPTIITEYLPKGSLKKILQQNRRGLNDFDWNASKKYISLLGITSAMKYLHQIGILHRDLKPENILIDDNYYPRVGDFGLAKCFPESLTKSVEGKFSMELGTPKYMSPEIIDPKKDKTNLYAVDVYAFGILAFEIITGREPFAKYNNLSTFALHSKIINGLHPIFTKDDNIPDKMISLITRCWSYNPSDRPSFEYIFSELSSDFSYFYDLDIVEVNKYLQILFDWENKSDDKTTNEESDKEMDEQEKKDDIEYSDIGINTDNLLSKSDKSKCINIGINTDLNDLLSNNDENEKVFKTYNRIIKSLCGKVNINKINTNEGTILHTAVMTGNVELLKNLISLNQIDINSIGIFLIIFHSI